ncbi:MAG: hypothetical protein M3506_06695, partial [Chloroflexota bacterium]|nr:hypothetical protein [Chloroflexota bacterium]
MSSENQDIERRTAAGDQPQSPGTPVGTAVLEPVREQPRQERRPQNRSGGRRQDGRNNDSNEGRSSRDGRDGRNYRDNRNRRPQAEAENVAGPGVGLIELRTKSFDELTTLAREFNVEVTGTPTEEELAWKVLEAQIEQAGFVLKQGVLDIIEDGFGFLRHSRYLPSPDDIYVSQSQIRRFSLRTGDHIVGQLRPPKETEKYHSLLRVETVNGIDPDVAKQRPNFDQLTPIFPNQQFILETGPRPIETRIIDMVVPIGRGQRGLIVSPPKAGKTSLLKSIAKGITDNYADAHLMVLLIGERPE